MFLIHYIRTKIGYSDLSELNVLLSWTATLAYIQTDPKLSKVSYEVKNPNKLLVAF